MHPKKIDETTNSGTGNQPLPGQFARSLKPESRQALMHGVRRRILRMLNQDPTPRTTQDLLKTFPELSLSSVNYHVLVLDQCGSLTISRVRSTVGSFTRVVTSNVADDPQFEVVLRATESMDDVR